MAKRMIMTGWGLQEYAPAAAMLLRCVFDCNAAEVQGVSQRYLPEALKKCEESCSEVYVLGIGLTYDPKAVAAELRKLKEAGVKVWWISRLPIPQDIAVEFMEKDGSSVFQNVVVKEGGTLLDAVRAAFPKRISEGDVAEFFPHLNERLNGRRSKSTSEEGKYRHLFVAADWKHKTDREMGCYPSAICHLARGVKYDHIDPKLHAIVDYYNKWGNRELIGDSEHICKVREMAEDAAKNDESDVRVLITGPSGTGKETVAQMIHRKSSRAQAAFLTFNCACTTENLFESKLFGCVEGAFTGSKNSEGLFETAADGTLFLDEVAELNLYMQGQLLRVLQDGDYLKVGESLPRKIRNVRVIAATNKDLVQLVNEGRFREDLYYRLNVIQIRMKALSQHSEDIPQIARTIWRRETGGALTADQCEALKKYDYPGNARELENMLTLARVRKITDFAELVRIWKQQNKGLHHAASARESDDADETVDSAVKRHVLMVADKYPGISITELARKLGKCPNTVRDILNKKRVKK